MVRTKGGGVWVNCKYKYNGVLRVCLVLDLKMTVLEDGVWSWLGADVVHIDLF